MRRLRIRRANDVEKTKLRRQKRHLEHGQKEIYTNSMEEYEVF